MRRTNLFSLGALVAPLLIVSAILPTHAADGTPAVSATTDRAQDLLAQANQAISETPRLTADFEIVTLAGAYLDTRETGTVRLAKPGDVRIAIDRFRRRNAGDAWDATHNGSLTVRSEADGIAHSLTIHPKSTQYKRLANATPESLLASLTPLQAFFRAEEATPARYVGERDWEGTRYSVVEQNGTGGHRTLFISPKDGLIHRAVVETASARTHTNVTRDIALRNIRLGDAATDAAGPTAFTFTPPADTIPVKSARVRSSVPMLAVGDLAPDFVVEDAAGKPVHLSEIAKNKVVVLKFWATWCWPCNQSLPETERLAASYGKKDDIAVFAVALWDSRDAFRTWITEKAARTPHIRYAFDPAPQGTDVGSSLYGVAATPTQFVIGRDGRIVAVTTGYTGPSPVTEAAVQQALAKPTGGSVASVAGRNPLP